MKFRKTEDKDRAQVVWLWRQAQAYFQEAGIDQWQDGYPNEESLKADMASGESYVLADPETGLAVATAFVSFAGEPDYNQIYEGSWQDPEPYGVVHRVAVAPGLKGYGLAGLLIAGAEALCRERGIGSLRIDTHEKNLPMQGMLAKNGFIRRGIIYLGRGGARRAAFEKRVSR